MIRFTILNIIGAALLVAAWMLGLLDQPFTGLAAPFCYAIATATLIGILAVGFDRPKTWKFIAANLTLMGLIGTADGFRLVLAGMSNIKGGDPLSAVAVLSTGFASFSVAIWSTLFGLIGLLWIRINVWALDANSLVSKIDRVLGQR